VVFSQSGGEGLSSFVVLVGASILVTVVFLSIAAMIASASVGRRQTKALAVALVVWFGAVVLFDVAALGLASLLPSGPASRVLIVGVLVNPVDAVRTGTLLGTSGTGAFGAASLAFLRFTKGPLGAGLLLGASLAVWVAAPLALAVRRLQRSDI
jgi:Cu-processing system permease protein